MKRVQNILFTVFLISSLATVFACSHANDILATSNIQNITRLDFYNWLKNRKYPEDQILKSKDKQKSKLSEMALELYCLEKANKESYDKSIEFQAVKERITENILYNNYVKEIQKNITYNEPAIRVSYILLKVDQFKQDANGKNTILSKKELEEKFNEKTLKAKDIIQKLDKGEDFEDLSKKYSDDIKKKKINNKDFIVYDMMPVDFSNQAFKLKKNEYTREPVRASTGIYIIKVHDIKYITEKNIEDVIKNKKYAQQLRSSLIRKYTNQYFDNLQKAKDAVFFENKSIGKNNDIIFRIGYKNFTVADLNMQIEKRQSKEERDVTYKNGYPANIKEDFARNCFQFELWKRDALNIRVDKNPGYIEDLQNAISIVLAGEFFRNLSLQSSAVTDKEIQRYYDENKGNEFAETASGNSKHIKRNKPLKEVRNIIQDKLKAEKMRNLTNQILNEISFKIDETKLKGK